MNRFYLSKLLILTALFSGWICKANAQTTLTYSQNFIGGATPTTQCTAWDAFRASLTTSYTYLSFTISGSQNTTGITCTNPTIAAAVAAALRTATAGSWSSDGQNWGVYTNCGSGCGGTIVELTNTGSGCNCNSGYNIRPNIANSNWGGINGTTCGAVSQTMTVVFNVIPPNVAPTFVGGTPKNMSVCQDAAATSINTLLTINDGDLAQTERWMVTTAPARGTLAGFPATATSTGGNVVPSGLTYRPNPGYSGADSFTINVSDGTVNISTKVYVTVNLTPTPITGNTNLCTGVSSALSTTPPSGTWSSSAPAIATVNVGTGLAAGVSPGTSIITYSLPTGCNATTAVTVNTQPPASTGPSAVCVGSSIALSNTMSGGRWISSAPALATIGSLTGIVNGIAAGAVSMSYQMPSGCYVVSPVTVNPLPASISGVTSLCVGQSSTFTTTSTFGTWSSSNTFQASVNPATGLVTAVAAGAPSIMYTLPTGCTTSAALTVNPLPLPITGVSSVCAGSVTTLTGSGVGTFASGNLSLATVHPISGLVTGIAAGTVPVTFTHTATGCFTTIPVLVNPKPNVNTVTGGGGYCPGGAGVHIGLDGSVNGVNYQLYYGSTPVGPVVPGSLSGLDFGVLSSIGTYTVMATNAVTGCSNDMAGSATIYEHPLPAPFNVTGGGSYCAGGAGSHIYLDGSVAGISYKLFNGVSPGAIVLGTGSTLDFGPQTGAGSYTVMATDPVTLCSASMVGSQDITISARPTFFDINAGGRYCAGGAGVEITLSNSTPGVNYRLFNGLTQVDSVLGIGGILSFGNKTAPGSYTIVGINISNNCYSPMNGTAVIGINPLPTAYNVSGGGAYCTGSVGPHVGLDFSVNGTDYTLTNSLTGVISTVAGANSGLDFGIMSAPGVYTVSARIAATGCTNNMAGSVTVTENTLPTAYNVTGGGDYCVGGAGVPVGLDLSEPGFKYQLYKGGSPIGGLVTGTGLALNFGLQTAPGVYTVQGRNNVTGCVAGMTGGVNVAVKALPTVYTVMGGGNYCEGAAGAEVRLSSSDTGVNYQLWTASTLVATVAGVGGPLSFGLQTIAGTYRVVAVNAYTPCTRNMNGTVTVGINPLPASYRATGGGDYCSGGSGRHIGLTTSNRGISYQLLNGLTPVGVPLDGTGSVLDFGTLTGGGAYTILATNVATGCAATMAGIANININQLPDVFNVTGGGAFCEGTTGITVGLDSAVAGINYQLWNGTRAIGAPVTGTTPISFGAQTVSGFYTVIATNPVTTCSALMAGNANVLQHPAPRVYTVSGGGSYCAGGSGVHILLSGSELGGITYQVYKDMAPVGSFFAGTGIALDLGAYTDAGTYKIMATNTATSCTSAMNDSASIAINPLLTPSVTVNATTGANICAGVMATYTPTAVNGGSSPTYEWKVNGATMGYGASFRYAPANNDSISVILTSNALCATPTTADSKMIMTVNSNATPSVSVAATGGSKVCPGQTSTFTATPVFGGTAPAYTWRVNGLIVGTNSPAFSYVANDSDVVFCTMASNFACRTSDFVLSNNVIITVDAPIMPSFIIEAEPGTTINSGEPLTLKAVITNDSPVSVTYQWSVNGVAIAGATNAEYTSATLRNFDVVKCCVTNHNSCGASAAVCNTETIVVHANVGVTTTADNKQDVALLPNPNKGAFTIKGYTGAATGDYVTLEVTNIMGQMVHTQSVLPVNGRINEQLQMNAALANGMYILNMRSAAGSKAFHFVIER